MHWPTIISVLTWAIPLRVSCIWTLTLKLNKFNRKYFFSVFFYRFAVILLSVFWILAFPIPIRFAFYTNHFLYMPLYAIQKKTERWTVISLSTYCVLSYWHCVYQTLNDTLNNEKRAWSPFKYLVPGEFFFINILFDIS